MSSYQIAASIKEEDRHILEEEETIFSTVKESVRNQALLNKMSVGDLDKDLLDLREVASTAHAFDLPQLVQQLTMQQKLLSRNSEVKLPDMRSPYFAHIKLHENDKIKDILIGHQTFIDTNLNVKIIDWRHAPIAQIFFNYKEGDTYEEEMPGGPVTGTILARRIITFEKGNLIGISNKIYDYIKDADSSTWQENINKTQIELKGGSGSATRGFVFGTGLTKQKIPDISALIDPEQYAILQTDENEPLLILGAAGCGKTTVALHRISTLFYKDSTKFAQHKQLVLVPEEGLARLSRKLLKNLSVESVKVMTFDEWVTWQGRYLLRDLPSTVITDTPPRVSRFKRSPAILKALKEMEEIRKKDFASQIKNKLNFDKQASDYFLNQTSGSLLSRVHQAKEYSLIKANEVKTPYTKQRRLQTINDLFDSLERQIYGLNRDRIEFFSNKALLNKVIELSEGALQASIADEVFSRSLIQFSEKSETIYAGVDDEHKTALDEKSLDEDTPHEIADTIDLEDFAILLSLLRLYTGSLSTPYGRMHTYSHVVLDEAQEIAPVELSIIASTLESDATVTIAGDSAQQTDSTTTFSTWQAVLEQLGLPHAATHNLKTNYRTTKQIMDFANKILGDQAHNELPKSIKEGPDVIVQRYADEGLSCLILNETLSELMAREPTCSVAVIAANFENARSVFDSLRSIHEARLIRNGEFEFKPGIDVTDYHQIKGLEFDYVVIPDADAKNYPETNEARRMMHVAATRAIHQLLVMSVRTQSFIIT